MADRRELADLADQAAAALLKAVVSAAPKSQSTDGILHLAHAYALVGRQSDAHALFDQVVELAGPTGLLSEQYDPRAERALGNHPQAYSHLGLIRTALVLDRLPR